jgi:hypothetical protein
MTPEPADTRPANGREEALAAAARHDWPRVRDLLSSAARGDTPLDGDAQELLATALLLTGQPAQARTAFEATYRAHV